MPKILKSNEYWDRRSGSIDKNGNRMFKLKKYGNGAMNSGKSKK